MQLKRTLSLRRNSFTKHFKAFATCANVPSFHTVTLLLTFEAIWSDCISFRRVCTRVWVGGRQQKGKAAAETLRLITHFYLYIQNYLCTCQLLAPVFWSLSACLHTLVKMLKTGVTNSPTVFDRNFTNRQRVHSRFGHLCR